MRICVFGAGAIGGHIATRLAAAAAHDVTVVARGAVLNAIRERGLSLHSGGRVISARPRIVTDEPAALPAQDSIIVALKAPALPAAAAAIARLLAPEGCAMFVTNGIPWWWSYGLDAAPRHLPLLDPQAALWTGVKPERALAGIVYSMNAMVKPAVIHHSGNDRWLIGEPDGSRSRRLEQAVAALRGAGLGAAGTHDLRREIWRKLVTTSSGNPVSALTRLNVHALGAHAETRALLAAVMRETLAVGAALGYDLHAEVDVGQAARRADAPPDQRPHSMLWDVLTQRPLEVEALLGQTQAFARDVGVAVPTIDVLAALLRGLDRAGRELSGHARTRTEDEDKNQQC